MIFTCKTKAEAMAKAEELRSIHEGEDWEVSISAPLFPGDLWTVTVG